MASPDSDSAPTTHPATAPTAPAGQGVPQRDRDPLATGSLRHVLARPFHRSSEHRAPSRAGRNLPAAVTLSLIHI